MSEFCPSSGRLVGANHPVPADAFDRDVGLQPVGCNALRCTACGERVRQRAGLSYGAEAAQLFATDDWQTLVHDGTIEEDDDSRLYACACTLWVEEYDRQLGDRASWDERDTVPRWTCGGHPGLAQGATLDGVNIDDNSVYEAIIEHSNHAPDAAPPVARTYAGAWVHRMVHLVGVTPAVRDALQRALAHPDPAVRCCVADLYRRTPHLAGGELVARAVLAHPNAWFGLAHPHRSKRTLDWPAQVAIAHRAAWHDPLGSPLDLEAMHAAKRLVLLPHPPTQALLAALATHASDWLAEHTATVVQNNPHDRVVRDVLYVFRHDEDRREAIVRTLSDAAAVPPERLHSLVRQLVPQALGVLGG